MSDHLQLQGIVDLSDENGQPLFDETGAVLLDESSPNNGLLKLQTGDLLLLAEQTDNIAAIFPLLTAALLGQIETVGSITSSFFKFTASLTGEVTNPTVGSGIYKLVPLRAHDTYYSALVPLTTTNVKIP